MKNVRAVERERVSAKNALRPHAIRKKEEKLVPVFNLEDIYASEFIKEVYPTKSVNTMAVSLRTDEVCMRSSDMIKI